MNVLKFYCYQFRPPNDDRLLNVDEEKLIFDTRIIINSNVVYL